MEQKLSINQYQNSKQQEMYSAATHSPGPLGFIPPQQMLSGLLCSEVGDCYCTDNNNKEEEKSENLLKIENAIQGLHHTLQSMNNQVIQVENLLTQRDVLYHQLDHLRAEREQIQDQIASEEYTLESTYKIANNRGIKEMNQRLRRRIRQVKDYIDKMENENQKIQQTLSYNYQPQVCNYTEYGGGAQRNPTWVQRINQHPTSNSHIYKKQTHQYFDGIRKRLHEKQEQAWDRVRRQQQQMQARNARSLVNFGRHTGGMRPTYLSPKFRGY